MSRYWLALILLYHGVSAASASAFEDCALVGDLAKQIMAERQKGVDRSTVSTLTATTPDLREMLKGIAEVAYSYPTYPAADAAEQAVIEFGDSLRRACEERKSQGG